MAGIVAGTVREAREDIVSPAELLKIFLDEAMDRDLVKAGAVVGGADDIEQQAGAVALMDAGPGGGPTSYAPIIKKRVQVRVMGPSLWDVEKMGRHVDDLLEHQSNLEIEDSEDRRWFVHSIYLLTLGSHHIDSSETWEWLSFATIVVGRDPLGVP